MTLFKFMHTFCGGRPLFRFIGCSILLFEELCSISDELIAFELSSVNEYLFD